jgi:hypothetical protein
VTQKSLLTGKKDLKRTLKGGKCNRDLNINAKYRNTDVTMRQN